MAKFVWINEQQCVNVDHIISVDYSGGDAPFVTIANGKSFPVLRQFVSALEMALSIPELPPSVKP